MPRRPPVRIKRRSPADVLAALAAIVALAALVAGVPFALLRIFGSPVPQHMPTLETFTQPIGVSTVLYLLSILVWLAWLQLLWCVVVEVLAAVRGVGVPARVPLAGGTQAMAHRLVATALLLFTVSVAVAPVFSHGGRHLPPPKPSHTVSAVQRHGGNAVVQGGHQDLGGHAGQGSRSDQGQHADHEHAGRKHDGPRKIYRVQPPHGRHHESLWEIAQKHLGDGRRYKEIYALNKGKEQPDGSKLTEASLIRPGWVLDMPDDATGVQIVHEHHGGTHHEQHQHQGGGQQGGQGQHAGQQGGAAGGGAAGGGAAGGGAAGGGAQRGGAHQGGGRVVEQHQQQAPIDFLDELAIASLAAAGLLAALGRRRREQLWRRAFGTRIPVPDGDAALAETALRVGASEPTARLLDRALRQLSAALAAEGRTLPTVYAAHVGDAHLSLWVYPPDRGAPAPWDAGDGQVWQYPVAELPALEAADLSGALAPYPGLVSIGTNDQGRVLVDLEAAHGLIAVRGDGDMVQGVLAGLAVELATNRWSDDMRLTLVGFGADLVPVAPDRLRVVDTLDEVLPELEAEAAEMTDALAAAGIDSVLTGRARGRGGSSWAPHYLIMATPPSESEAAALRDLARTGPRTATGYVVAGEVPGATWTWTVSEEGRLRVDELRLDVSAQLIPERHYSSVVELFRTATRFDGAAVEPDPEPTEGASLDPNGPAAAEVRLLGRVEVTGPGPMEPDRRALATEVVAYLAAHPEGVHPTVLGSVIWPRGVSRTVRDATVSRVGAWLGNDELGRPNLVAEMGGRLRLGSQVRVDWQVLRGLVARAARASDPGRKAELLGQALDQVHGPLLHGRESIRYSWLAGDDLESEVDARVADAAHELADLRLVAGDAAGAVRAARAGLLLATDDATLWRDLLRATHATGDTDAVRAAVEEMRARASGAIGGLPAETEALVEEVMPAWGERVAASR